MGEGTGCVGNWSVGGNKTSCGRCVDRSGEMGDVHGFVNRCECDW